RYDQAVSFLPLYRTLPFRTEEATAVNLSPESSSGHRNESVPADALPKDTGQTTAPEDASALDNPNPVTPEAVRLRPDGLPAQVGRYEVEEEIGRGGMGQVLRARDTAFERSLAVKVLLEAYRDRPELVRRFVEEARVMGQLQHPGIAPV